MSVPNDRKFELREGEGGEAMRSRRRNACVHACLFKRPSLATRHDLIKANFTVQVIFEPVIEFVLCIKPLKSLKIIIDGESFRRVSGGDGRGDATL